MKVDSAESPEETKVGTMTETAEGDITKEGNTSPVIRTKLLLVGTSDRDLATSTADLNNAESGLEPTEDNMILHGDDTTMVENVSKSANVVIEAPTPSSLLITAPIARYIPIAERTHYQQLTSGPAFLLAIFFPIHVTSWSWSITTTRDFWAYLGDDELDNKYLTIFTSIMPASILAVPLVDLTVSRFGYAGGFFAINLLALAYGVIRLSSDNLNFGVVMSFLPELLAQSVTGKAAGFLYMLAGVFSLVNLPMANLATKRFDGDFFWPNLVYTLLLLPCIAAAWGLARAIQREDAAKMELLSG